MVDPLGWHEDDLRRYMSSRLGHSHLRALHKLMFLAGICQLIINQLSRQHHALNVCAGDRCTRVGQVASNWFHMSWGHTASADTLIKLNCDEERGGEVGG